MVDLAVTHSADDALPTRSLPTPRRAGSPPAFEVVVHAEREAVRVAASGELDFATIDRLRDEAEELIAAGFQSVIIDLRGLTRIDRAGLHLLDRLADSAQRASCDLTLIPGAAAAAHSS
jgi:anti-anti-sigma factor